MPETKSQGFEKNPFAIPEPYYLPGYTGHCPKFNNIIGETYGRATHIALQEEPTATGRLKPLPTDGSTVSVLHPTLGQKELDIMEERQSTGMTIISKDMAPGYQGHVPLASEMIGLTFNQSCIKGIVEFEKKRRQIEEKLKEKTIPDPV